MEGTLDFDSLDRAWTSSTSPWTEGPAFNQNSGTETHSILVKL